MPNFNDECVLERDSKTKKKHEHPKMWNVIMLNDDITPMDFVVIALVTIFDKSPEEAMKIMISIHTSDKGIVGTYTLEDADRRLCLLDAMKEECNVPLLAVIEEAK